MKIKMVHEQSNTSRRDKLSQTTYLSKSLFASSFCSEKIRLTPSVVLFCRSSLETEFISSVQSRPFNENELYSKYEFVWLAVQSVNFSNIREYLFTGILPQL